jgi:Helix-turn-helix domain
MQEILEMSKKEIDRLHILQKLLEKQITQKKAAELLNLKSDRHVRNLLSNYRQYGAKGLISKQRGKPSNRTYHLKFKNQIMSLVREKYPDFGPTFATEKLSEYHNISISEETLRKWMIEENLWVSRKKKHRIHPLRPRRFYFGELIQIDGSHHDWFEGRAGKCVLIVFIDDATSKITSMFFCNTECIIAYFAALKGHLLRYGRPVGLYSDRHAIFGGSDKIHHAQFIRAMQELGIKSILARSPQAKGRVERANQTLQDRLIKEMRLRNICSIEDANRYLPKFIEEYNKKFSKEPRGQFDAHRPLDASYDLERILTRCEIRTLSKDLSFSFHSTSYQILAPLMTNRLKYKKIEIRQRDDGSFRAFHLDKELKFIPIMEYASEPKIVELNWQKGQGGIREGYPASDHPWKKYSYQWALKKGQRRLYCNE